MFGGSVVAIAFQSVWKCIKIVFFFYFLKIIFDISASK
jgi:hypothetical protein